MSLVFVGLGGNIGDSSTIVKQAAARIAGLKVQDFRLSGLYLTSPVSSVPQQAYVNAVCMFRTPLSSRELLTALQKIESDLGKRPKAKDQPRVIDLDILLFGDERCETEELQLPHPRWRERLFVLRPLRDLTAQVRVGERMLDLDEMIKDFNNRNLEKVESLDA